MSVQNVYDNIQFHMCSVLAILAVKPPLQSTNALPPPESLSQTQDWILLKKPDLRNPFIQYINDIKDWAPFFFNCPFQPSFMVINDP